MRQKLSLVLCACALALLAGCASSGSGGAPDGHATRSGVEVFGTIDASVSGVHNSSGR